jgi:hydroxypyruvate isomerase
LTNWSSRRAGHGIPGLIVFSGNRDGRDDDASIEVCATALRRVTPAAEKAGINLNMELLNSKRNHPDYQCDHSSWGVRLCQAVDSPRMKLLYDIFHMAIMEGDLIATIRENIRYIGHFHTAGNPGRGPLDENQEIYYPAVCRAIAEAGYDLFVGHEFRPEGDRLEALRAAFDVCNV